MRPIGLTLKNVKTNHFTGKISGEVMIVHQCLNCGSFSCNRIAGDDNPHAIIRLLDMDRHIPPHLNRGIRLLGIEDKNVVLTALYGYGYR